MSSNTLFRVACAGLLALGTAVPTLAATRVTVVGSVVVHNSAGSRSEAVRVMDQSVRRYLEGKGFQVRTVPARGARTLLTDRQLASIGRSTGADYVIYPKILSLGNTRDAVAVGRGRGTFATFYVRVVNPKARSKNRSVYFRQVGHTWNTSPADTGAYDDREAIPAGVARVFQYFRRR